MNDLLKHWDISDQASVQPINGGLINSTWKVTDGENEYVLQQINTNIFKQPLQIAENTANLKQHLQSTHSNYLLVAEIPTIEGRHLLEMGNQVFRLLPFVRNTHTISVVQTPKQAYQAARQFGMFTQAFKDFDANKLNITIPHFHDLSLRYRQFEASIKNGNQSRVEEARLEIQALTECHYLVRDFEAFVQHPQAKQRVTHHDTKISNVLFNDNDEGVCVIDLDTVMPGYFFSDVGDMMRTYLSPANEEENNLSQVTVRLAFFQAIAEGYLSVMKDYLSPFERGSFVSSGLWLTYMQALRFLTDHLNNDVYYGAKYADHNLLRARNQIRLMQQMQAQISERQSIVRAC